MDLARRCFKVSRDNNGMAIFIKRDEPANGFVVVYNKVAWVLADMTADAIRAQMRLYFGNHVLNDDGIAVWRKNGRQNIGVMRWFATLPEATAFANEVNAQHVWDLATKTSTQVNDFTLDLPGDGVTES